MLLLKVLAEMLRAILTLVEDFQEDKTSVQHLMDRI
jgi:hypothetical protein